MNVEIENIEDGASFVGAEVGFYELPKRCLLRCPGLFVSDGAILKGCNDASKLLRLLAVLQSSLSKISSFGGAYEMTFKDATGKPLSDKGKYVTVWKKQKDGTWKVLLDIFNTDLPPTGGI